MTGEATYPADQVCVGVVYSACPCCSALIPSDGALVSSGGLGASFRLGQPYVDILFACTCGANWSTPYFTDEGD